jgi:hypothetical protein
MTTVRQAAIVGWLAFCAPAAALAADHEAGVPLTPAEAAGAWTLESGGHSICVLSLGTRKVSSAGYAAQVPESCGDTLSGVAAWTPAAGGMTLVSADGRPVLGFGRWSNSLFVSHRSSGVDLQLKRGGPGDAPPGD